MRLSYLVPCILAMVGVNGTAVASPVHLGTPTVYDNAGVGIPWGQSFTAEAPYFLGIQWYIGDPSRPGLPSVNALEGNADLVLYSVANPASPVELGRRQVQSGATATSGLSSFLMAFPVATVAGQKYFAAIETADSFGLGLRALSSTYPGGSEAYILGTGFEEIGGRDTAFAVISSAVPEPGAYALLGLGLAVVGIARRRTSAAPGT